MGIEEQALHAYVAIQHLKYERSTVDLAEELGLSRFMVGRMVRRARTDGLIDITPRLPEPIDSELSQALARAYGLTSAIVVVPPANNDGKARTTVAKLAARFLTELIDEDDIVGLGPGRTIVETCSLISDVPNCDVVQLTGVAISAPDAQLHAIMALSRAGKGRMFPLHAPFVTTDHASWRAISAQPAVQQALKRMDNLDEAVLTVGQWPDSSLLADQLAELGELEHLRDLGVAAEIGTTLLDVDGRVVDALRGRVVGLTTEQLEKVPVRVALGGGPAKQRGVVAALKSGLVDVVVTDARTARVAIDSVRGSQSH